MRLQVQLLPVLEVYPACLCVNCKASALSVSVRRSAKTCFNEIHNYLSGAFQWHS